jgi:hypothetical protein
VGTLVPYDDPRLLNGMSNADAKASPFVISIQNAGIEVLPSVMNCVIMVSVISVGNSSIYGSSRTLAALAEQRQAPAFLAYIDRKGRPLYAIVIASVLGLLAYLAATHKQQDAFNWMLALSGLSSIFTVSHDLLWLPLLTPSTYLFHHTVGQHLPCPHPLPPRVGPPRPLARRARLPQSRRCHRQLGRPDLQHPCFDCPVLDRLQPGRLAAHERLCARCQLLPGLPRRPHCRAHVCWLQARYAHQDPAQQGYGPVYRQEGIQYPRSGGGGKGGPKEVAEVEEVV